jgi:DNA-binding NarL/FixJ family response regulator
MRPSILIADDHRLYAEALCAIVSPAYETVAVATNGRQLTSLAVQFKPDLVVTDHSMPVLNGLKAVRALTKIGLCSKFIVLTTNRDANFAVEAFRSGASAFLLKTGSSDELLKALSVVLDGGYYLSEQLPCDLETVLAEAGWRPVHGNPGEGKSPLSE